MEPSVSLFVVNSAFVRYLDCAHYVKVPRHVEIYPCKIIDWKYECMHGQICAFFFGRIPIKIFPIDFRKPFKSWRWYHCLMVQTFETYLLVIDHISISIFQLSCQKRDKNHQSIHSLPMHPLHSHKKCLTIPPLSIPRASSCKHGKFQCNVNYLYTQELSWAVDNLV